MSNNKSPEKQPQPKSGKSVTCNVVLLDGENIPIYLDKNDNGRVLFDKVCSHLDLIERDYFGFTYTEDKGPTHLKYWLNLDKKISKQKKRGPWVFDFGLKFYPPDPTHLRESLTRWLVVLQVRRDLLSGRLPCTFTTYALLGSYSVQADVGDYDRSNHENSYDYIKDMPFAPTQTPELLEKIAELHRHHKGQTPDEAERYFLDNSKKLSMYGVDMHKAKDSESKPIMLGVCASGLLVYRDKLRINRFVWPKILKLSYKRNNFYIKIRPGEMERNDTMIMFKLDNPRLAKRLWKTCVEHHAFFRLREAEKPNYNPTFPRFGSKFRYSGRTLYQTRQTAALLDRPQPFFERSQPARNTFHEAGNRSHSVDELASRPAYDQYGDLYDPKDPKYGDENDRRDMKPDSLAHENVGRDGQYYGDGNEDTLQKRPYDGNTSEDIRDRMPSQGDATLERDRDRGQGQGDDSMDVMAGEVHGKPETDKERRKREKEEDKMRRKEVEEKRKKEEEDKKRAEKDKKRGKGGDLPYSEDRTDNLGPGEVMETSIDGDPGRMGVDGGALLLGPNAGEDGRGEKDPNRSKDEEGRYGDAYDKNAKFDAEGKPISFYPDGNGRYGVGYGPEGREHLEGQDKYGRDAKDKDGKDKWCQDGKDKDEDGKDKDKDGKDKNKDRKDKDGKDRNGKVKKSGSFFGRKKKDKGDDGSDSDEAGRNGSGIPRGDKAGLLGLSPDFPYGVGLRVGKADLTGVVGEESSVDNKQQFLPQKEKIKKTKESLQDGYTDNMMPFFHPAATSTVGRSKVPPPVPPKGSFGLDDSFTKNDYKTEKDGVETTRVVQKVVMSGDEDDDFDQALADAIRSVTEFNPDMSVERIECVQEIEDMQNGK